MAENLKYNREEIYGDKREKMKQEIAKDKNKIKYDTSTPEGKAKLSEAWMTRANLSEAQKENIFQKLGFKEKPDLTTKEGQKAFTEAVKRWQSDPVQANKRGTIGKADGILGWATLEALDSDNSLARVPEKTDTKQEVAQKEVNNFIERLSHQQRLEDAQNLITNNELSESGKLLFYNKLESDNKIGSKWVATKSEEGIYQLSDQ